MERPEPGRGASWRSAPTGSSPGWADSGLAADLRGAGRAAAALAGWLAPAGVPLSRLSSEMAGEYAAVRRDPASCGPDGAPAGAELPAGAGSRPARLGRRAARARRRAARAVRGMAVPRAGLAPATVSSYLPGAAVRRCVRRAAQRPDRCPGLGPGRCGSRGASAPVPRRSGERRAAPAAFRIAGRRDRSSARRVRRVTHRPAGPAVPKRPQAGAGS